MSQILLQLNKLVYFWLTMFFFVFILELSTFTSLLLPLQRRRPQSHTAIYPLGNRQTKQGDV